MVWPGPDILEDHRRRFGALTLSSFNTHKRYVLNPDKPLPFRFSHLRSCLNKVANLLDLKREDVIGMIEAQVAVNVNINTSEEALLTAFGVLERLRNAKLGRNTI